MKLYNHTPIDDKILYTLLLRAAKSTGIGVRTQNVVVKVTHSHRYLKGWVEQATNWSYLESALTGRSPKKDSEDKVIRTDGGYIFLSIPVVNHLATHSFPDSLELGEKLFELAAHEWRHIADSQKGRKFGDYNRRWKNRPHERRAIRTERKAANLIKTSRLVQEAILEFAIAVEKIRDKKEKQIK